MPTDGRGHDTHHPIVRAFTTRTTAEATRRARRCLASVPKYLDYFEGYCGVCKGQRRGRLHASEGVQNDLSFFRWFGLRYAFRSPAPA